MALIRLWLIVFALQLALYLGLRISIRLRQVRRLEARWDSRHSGQGDTPARRAFVARGTAGFGRSLQVRLAALVFVLPTLAILGIVVLVNWQ
ncbi:hypothetical protein [Paracoccus beibuensis]|uniref:hypothetical protein n=1 Tax=Paracoccus beibuensis TaxID=547602 RepID=UPI00223EFD71|nr:hypothetical protein [Paracoccus beibuensis]